MSELFVEKYRPAFLADCILESKTQEVFQSFIDKKSIPNLLFCGSAGVGKTTVALSLCRELGSDYILINASDDRGIDVVRNKVKQFASTVSLLSGAKKVVILDEADNLTMDSQKSLRGVFEEFHKNCRFILTCNFKNKIIKPIHSRCSVIDFSLPASTKPLIAGKFLERVCSILRDEGIEYHEPVVAEIIMKYFPDFRRVLNEIQRYSSCGRIDSGILGVVDLNTADLIECLKKKEFTNVRKWVVNNLNNESDVIYRRIYDSLYDHLEPATIPEAVIIIAEYQYKSAFVADFEINLLAALTEIMLRCEFK